MIDWWIVISTQTPKERSRPHADDRRASILAMWEVGLGGLDWIERLVELATAQKIRGGGYITSAQAVLPLLVGGPPTHNGAMVIGDDYVMLAKWVGKVEMHPDRKEAWPRLHQLTI